MRFAILAFLLLLSPAAAETRTFTGKVLPFKIIAAVRNFGVTKGGVLPAQVAIAVVGGTQADWLATAAYVAEKSIVNGVTCSTVEVFFENPWGDKPPTRNKLLAKAYYSGPDPSRSPWPYEPWLIDAQGHAPTLADVEFDALFEKLLREEGPRGDPDKQADEIDAKAIGLLVGKYRLPQSWKPDDQLGDADPNAVEVTQRDRIRISDAAKATGSIKQMRACLMKDDGQMSRGCQDRSKEYRFANP